MAPAALLVVLEAGKIQGEFSDNLITLSAWYGDSGDCVEAGESGFRTSDKAMLHPTSASQREVCFSAKVMASNEALDLQAFEGNVTAVALNSEGGLWWNSTSK